MVLHAPLEIAFDYTRSLGPVLSQFMTGLAGRRILGSRASDGRVHAPPLEYDPITLAPTTSLVEVADSGTIVSFTAGWALITLDGADTPMLHRLQASNPHVGMQVRAHWSDTPNGSINDILHFSPDAPESSDRTPGGSRERSPAPVYADAVTMITTPIRLSYEHYASPSEESYLLALADGRLIGQRCPSCAKVLMPPRGACPACGVATVEEVALPDTGTITTFCIVNVPFQGQKIDPPYVSAYVLLDGADIPWQHLILGCTPDQVRMGMRVRAAWKPRAEWTTSPLNITHFEPTGEPDATYETYKDHL